MPTNGRRLRKLGLKLTVISPTMSVITVMQLYQNVRLRSTTKCHDHERLNYVMISII